VPVNRPITIQDLMTHTSGITYGFYGDGLVRKLYVDAKIMTAILTMPNSPNASLVFRWPTQPGTLWDYGHSTDILGASSRWCRENRCCSSSRINLLGPLGMTDTSFFVTDPAKHKMIAQPMPNDRDFTVGLRVTPKL
jgi:CubicO group peptidase (beta-lactamase class C family)